MASRSATRLRTRCICSDGARGLPDPLRACRRCDKLYWPGGHVRRMRDRLEAWAGAGRARRHKGLYPETGRALP